MRIHLRTERIIVLAFLVVALLITAGAALGVASHGTHSASQTQPATPGYSQGHDWTVAPCTAFGTEKPIPAYTMTDRCVAPDGRMIVDGTLTSTEVFPTK